MPGEHVADVLTLLSPASMDRREQIADLPQLEPELLCLFDKPESRDCIRQIDAESTLGPRWLRHEPEPLVVPNGIGREARRLSDRAEPLRLARFRIHQITSMRTMAAAASRLTAAVISPRQQAPRGFRTSHAQRPA